MKMTFKFFRDDSPLRRLRCSLYINGAKVATKPVERVIDNAPLSDRHRYNIAKVFGLHQYWSKIPMDIKLRLMSADDGDIIEVSV